MSHGMLNTERIVRLLTEDAVRTLGERARTEVRSVATNMEENARVWLEQGDNLAAVQRDFNREVVDHFQQDVHDDHWDTTWPACPRHPNHPLWYDDRREAWYCPRNGEALARLGELASLRPLAT